jgi:type I restriction enzyme R subunit
VLDVSLIEDLAVGRGDPKKKIKEVEVAVDARIARHGDDPVLRALGERVQELLERYANGQQASLGFLRQLLARHAILLLPRRPQMRFLVRNAARPP